MSEIKHIAGLVLGMPMRKIVDSGAYKCIGSVYFVVLLHVSCVEVRIKSDEDKMRIASLIREHYTNNS